MPYRKQWKKKSERIASGIKSWLTKKGFNFTPEQYEELLKEFAVRQLDTFDADKATGIESYEKFAHKRFKQFCSFILYTYKIK